MKKRWMKALSTLLIGILLVVLLITCPNEQDYAEWLADRHRLVCTFETESGLRECEIDGQGVKENRSSSYVQHAGIYMKVEDSFTIRNTTMKIRAFGILGHFWDYSEFIIKD